MPHPSPTRQPVHLVGASVRGAAHSAWRAGWRDVRCVDLFGDRDLARLFPTTAVPLADYPRGLVAAIEGETGPTIYTGALENRPDLLAKLPQPLWGNPPDVVRQVRDPHLWHDALQTAGLPVPALRFEPTTSSKPRWLVKPIRSGGGLGIHPYGGGSFNPRTHFLQVS